MHQDRQLLWTQAPLLSSGMTPPRSHWRALGLLHPPPANIVLAHVQQLVALPPDLWPYGEPMEETLGTVVRFLGEQWQVIPPTMRAAFSETPLLLCGAAFTKPRRVFRSVFAACSPLLQSVDTISCSPLPMDEVRSAAGQPSIRSAVGVRV